MPKTLITFLSCLLFVLQPILCPAPIYIKIDDIEGEVADTAHFKWSLAESVAFEVDRSGGPDADPQFGDFVFVKKADRASPKLMEACVTGTFFSNASFDLTRELPGGGERAYMRYRFSDVLVSSYSVHGSAGGESLPTEDITFSHEQIKVSYRGVRKTYLIYDENGQLVEEVSVGLTARLGGTPPPEGSASDATETLAEQDESIVNEGDTTEAKSVSK